MGRKSRRAAHEAPRPQAESTDAQPTSQFRPWLKRPVTWLGGIVVAALGIVLTNALVDRFDDALQPVLEGGDPVVVEDVSTYRSDQLGNSVVFPRGTSFTDEKIAELNAQDDTVAWLEGRGGVAPSTVFIRMVLAGNRETPVRLLDVEVVPRCTEPLDGVLFEDPPAGADHLPG